MHGADADARARLGTLLIRQRVKLDSRYKNRQLFADERGINYRLVADIENGRPRNYEESTIAAVENAYALTPGSVARLLDCGELGPQHVASPARRPRERAPHDFAGNARPLLEPFIQAILRGAFGLLGMAEAFGDTMPDPCESPELEDAVGVLSGGLLFPDSPREAQTWDSGALLLREKLDLIAKSRWLEAGKAGGGNVRRIS